MPEYRYQLCDLVTDDHLAWLPLVGVDFERRIVQAGGFSASLPITNRHLSDLVARVIPRREDDLSAGPGRCVIYVWRGDAIWGCYVIWRAHVEGDDRGRATAQLKGAHLESILHRILIDSTTTYDQWDQSVMARDLIEESIDEPGSQWGPLNLGGGPAFSGVLRDRTYHGGDMASLGQRLEELSEVIDGPEWYIRAYVDSTGARRREFYVDLTLGQTDTSHIFSQPGNILSWKYSGDATDTGVRYTVRGDETDTDGRRAQFGGYSDPHFDAGWPTMEEVRDYSTVTEIDTLVDYAAWWATYRAGATYTLEVTVRLPEHPTLTPDRLGDYARFTMVNEWWPLDENGAPTMVQWRRVIGMEVTPPDRDTGQETARLIVEAPRDDPAAGEPRGYPLYPPDMGQRIARYERGQRMIVSGTQPIGS